MPRLTASVPGSGGYTRRRAGTGFTYRGANGRRITNTKTLERIRSLVIPPAWTDVWIAASENAHIQATGIDDAGRKQYLYHPSGVRGGTQRSTSGPCLSPRPCPACAATSRGTSGRGRRALTVRAEQGPATGTAR